MPVPAWAFGYGLNKPMLTAHGLARMAQGPMSVTRSVSEDGVLSCPR